MTLTVSHVGSPADPSKADPNLAVPLLAEAQMVLLRHRRYCIHQALGWILWVQRNPGVITCVPHFCWFNKLHNPVCLIVLEYITAWLWHIHHHPTWCSLCGATTCSPFGCVPSWMPTPFQPVGRLHGLKQWQAFFWTMLYYHGMTNRLYDHQKDGNIIENWFITILAGLYFSIFGELLWLELELSLAITTHRCLQLGNQGWLGL